MDDPSPKRRKVTDYFEKLPRSTEQQDFPAFLKQYHPTDIPRRPSRSKRPVGRPRKTDSVRHADIESSQQTPETLKQSSEESKGTRKGVYRSYSLSQKLEIVRFARVHSEAAASRKYSVSRSTIYGWKDIDKEPIAKISMATKGKHLKRGAGRPISYPLALEEELIEWVLRQRDLQLPVRRQDIQMRATGLITPHHPSFKASCGWVEKFMARHSLSLR